MKLKTLSINLGIIVAILAVAYFASQWLSPGTTEQPTQPQNLLPSEVLVNASQIKLYRSEDNSSLIIEKDDSGSWVVMDDYRFPVDFRKLQNLVQPLLEANIVRPVTNDPERIEKLGIGAYQITVAGKENSTLWSMKSGNSNTSGGLFVTIENRQEALLVDLPAFSFETDAAIWRRKKILEFSQDAIAQVAITFPDDAEPFIISRESPEDLFNSTSLDTDQQINQEAVSNLIGQILSTPYVEIVPIDNPEKVSAKDYSKVFTFTLFNGVSHTLGIGYRTKKSRVDLLDPSAPLILELELDDDAFSQQPQEKISLKEEDFFDEELSTFTETETIDSSTNTLEDTGDNSSSEEAVQTDSATENINDEFNEDFSDYFENENSKEVEGNKNSSKSLASGNSAKDNYVTTDQSLNREFVLFSGSEEVIQKDARLPKQKKQKKKKSTEEKEAKKPRWRPKVKVPFLPKKEANDSEKESEVPQEITEEPEETELEEPAEHKKSKWFNRVPLLSKRKEEKTKTESEPEPEEQPLEESIEEPIIEEKDAVLETDTSFWEDEFSEPKKPDTSKAPESPEIPKELEESSPKESEKPDQEVEPVQEVIEEERIEPEPKPTRPKSVLEEKYFSPENPPIIRDELSPPLPDSNSNSSNKDRSETRPSLFYETSQSRNLWENPLKNYMLIFPEEVFKALPSSRNALIEPVKEAE